jgi:hypothetical protein
LKGLQREIVHHPFKRIVQTRCAGS